MLFSVVVPVYNVDIYIHECLQSLSDQTITDFEVILVDDGSTDDSGKICDEYAESHTNVKVIHKKNEGLLLARRSGIDICSGEYIIHCDSDDYIAKDALERIKLAIEKHHPDMVMYGYDVVDDSHKIIEEHFTVFDDNEIFQSDNKEILINQLCSTTWLNNMVTKAVRRELVDVNVDYSDYKSIKMGEDLFQVIPLVKNCKTFIYLALPLYFYRFNPSGMSKNISRNYLDNYMTVSDRMYELLCTEKVSKATMVNFYNRFVKDIYKYILRYIKDGITKEEYVDLLDKTSHNNIFIDAEKHESAWSRENKGLRKLITKENYGLVSVLAKTILRNRI